MKRSATRNKSLTATFAVLVALLAISAPPASAAPGGVVSPDGRYIVVLKDGVGRAGSVAAEHSARFGMQIERVYENALKGYAAQVPSGRLGDVRSDPRVAFVEADAIAHTTTVQTAPTWGLDRIDQRALPLSRTYTYSNTGNGVTAYILDSGIFFGHSQFGGRASSGIDVIDGGMADDCNGHGTHVAGTVGGTTYGVAKDVSLKSVRVLDCEGFGPWSGIIAGIDWVVADHVAGTPAVANMSIGGPASAAVDAAVNRGIADGVTFAVAAGNERRNACNFSPARVPAALTVGASTQTDTKASFSNRGSCVDWYAPGAAITSATMDGGSASWNGTSMATPHTAGVAALYLQSNPGAAPLNVANAISAMTTKSIIKESPKVSKPLLFANL